MSNGYIFGHYRRCAAYRTDSYAIRSRPCTSGNNLPHQSGDRVFHTSGGAQSFHIKFSFQETRGATISSRIAIFTDTVICPDYNNLRP